MSEASVRSSSTFATSAREHVRTALELVATRSAENAQRIAASLSTLSVQARALDLTSIADLAHRGAELGRRIDTDSGAVVQCVRALRDLGRALDALEKESRARGRVLLVDDSAMNASVVCDALERAAFEARHADNLDAAVAAVAQFSPHVVLADVHMPDATAVELCTRIRSAAGQRRVHVLLFSGLPDDALSELVHETHADGFVSKERGLDAVIEQVHVAYRGVAR